MIHGTRCNCRVFGVPGLLLMVGLSVAACGDPLEIDDPLTVLEDRVNNPVGANMLRQNARITFFRNVLTAAWETGLVADEFWYQQPSNIDLQQFPYDNQ